MVRSASAGLQQTSESLEEASQTFGASRFYTLRKITVPLVMANLIASCLLCFAYAMLDVSDSLILAMKDKFSEIVGKHDGKIPSPEAETCSIEFFGDSAVYPDY